MELSSESRGIPHAGGTDASLKAVCPPVFTLLVPLGRAKLLLSRSCQTAITPESGSAGASPSWSGSAESVKTTRGIALSGADLVRPLLRRAALGEERVSLGLEQAEGGCVHRGTLRERLPLVRLAPFYCSPGPLTAAVKSPNDTPNAPSDFMNADEGLTVTSSMDCSQAVPIASRLSS